MFIFNHVSSYLAQISFVIFLSFLTVNVRKIGGKKQLCSEFTSYLLLLLSYFYPGCVFTCADS